MCKASRVVPDPDDAPVDHPEWYRTRPTMEEPPRQVVSVRRWSVGSHSSDMDGNEEKPAAQGFSLDERLEGRQKAKGNESWTTGRADDDEIAELLDMLPNHGNAAAVNSHAGESRPGTRKSVLWDSAARAVTTAVTTAGAKTVDSSLRCSRRMSALPGAVVSIGNGQQKAVEARHEELVARLKLRADARGKSGRCFNIIDKTRKTRKSRAKDWEDDSDEGDFNPETVQSTGSSANLYPGGVRSSSTDYPGGGMYVVPLSRAGSSNLQRLISGSSAASSQGPQSDYESEIGGSAGSGKGNRRVRPEWPNSHCCKGLTAHWRRAYGSYVIALSGDAPMRRMCNAATLAFALYTLVATPYTLSFTHLALPAFGILDRISMSLFILDLFLGFTTSVNDEPVKSYSRLVTRYARSGWLVVDVVAALPYEEIAYAASLSNSAETSSRQDNAFSALRLLRCVKVLKMSTLARSAQGTLLWRISNEQRALFGIVKLIATVLVSAHFFACLWWYMQRAQLGMSSDQLFLALSEGSVGTWTWAQDMWPDITREDEPFIRTYGWYLLSLHAVLMFFGGNTNNTLFMWQEKVLGSFTMATGTVVTGYIVSQVSVLMASLQASERQYVHKLSQVNVTMEKLSVPKKLRSRVMDYYSYLWDRHGTFDVRNNFNLSSELSKCLNSEVSLFTYRQMVTRIPIFKRSSPRVVQAVITSLVPEIYVAGDFIVKAGTRNSAMYFIRDGRCSVLLDDADPERAALDAGGTFMRINTLRRNQHFGELSLLADGHRATAHILADTNVDLHAFYREDFENIKRDFPELLSELVRIVEKSVYGTKKGGGLGAVHKAFNSVQMQLVRFTTCTTAEAQAIVDAVVQVHFTGDDRIVTMGEPSDGLFFIIEGSCDVSVPSLQTDGHDLVGELVAGDFFGDLSLLNDSPASAFVTARSSIVVCHVLYREEYEVLKLTYPDLPQHLQITGRQKHYERLSPFLTRPSFFIGLEADLAHAILNTLEYRTYEPGEDIVRCGQPLFALLFLILGEARASIDLSTVSTAKLDVMEGRRRSSLFALKHDGAPNASSSQDASDAPSNLRRSVRASTGGHSSPSSPAGVGSALETPPQIDGPRPSSLPGPLAPVIVSGSRIPAAARPASPPPSPASHMHEAAEPGPNHGVSAQKDVQILRQSDVIGEECLLQPGSLAQMRVRALSMVETCALPCFAYAGIVEQFPHLQRHLRKRCEASLAGFSSHSLCAFLAVGSPLFEHADLELVEAVANALTVIPCTPGQQLITRGTSSRGLFIVHSGACDCLIPDPEDPGVRKRVATRIPGQHFGELSLLDPHSPTAADVIAAEGSTTTSACMNGQSPAAIVLLLTPEAFAGICERFEKFKGLLLASMPSYREYNFFYHLPVFHDAKHDFLLALVKAIVRRTFDAGTIIQRLGNQGPKGGKDSAAEDEDHSADGGAFFVDKGQLLATSPHAKAITLTEKDFFGLETLSGIAAGGAADDEKGDEHVPIALPAGSPPLQQVQAGTDVELFVLTIEAAAALAAQFPYMTEIGDAQQKALQTQPRQGFSGASGGQKPQSTTEEHDPFAISGSGASSPPRGGGGMVGAINASDGTLDADLLSQRLSLMQASIVATGRDMRERIGTMDRGIFEYLQRRDAQHAQAINQMTSRIEALTQAIEHPQRAARSTRVAFAPRSGSVASSGSRSTGSEPMIERSLTGSLTSMGSSAGCLSRQSSSFRSSNSQRDSSNSTFTSDGGY